MKEVPKPKKTLTERFDNFIGFFFPRLEYKRKAFRMVNKIAFRGAYDGASKNRLRESWLPSDGSADEDLLWDLPTLRERSRDLNRNDSHASGITSTIVVNVVGTGIRPQSRIDKESLGMEDAAANEFQRKTERAWQKWTPFADAGNRMSFWEIQQLVKRQIIENGEAIVIPAMIDEPGRPFYTALNIIEADRLQTPTDKIQDKNIRHGVELGDRGQPVAYWIKNTHPGDMTLRDGRQDATKYNRYPAVNKFGRKNVFHLYWVKRPGQSRGEPFFAPVITRFKDLADYMEAELVAARVAACFAAFIEKTDAYTGALTNFSRTNDKGQRIQELEPGMIEYLNQGEKVTQFNPQRPGSQFDPFVERVLRAIGAGLGLPYELVAKDFSKTNYSSARAAILEARKFFHCYQQWLAEKLCQPTWEMLLDEAFLRNEFEAENYFDRRLDWTRAKWIAPGWGYVDPEKEINAANEAVTNNLSTLADEAASFGRDWEEVLEQRAREEQKRKELGLPEPSRKEKVLVGVGADKQKETDDEENQ